MADKKLKGRDLLVYMGEGDDLRCMAFGTTCEVDASCSTIEIASPLQGEYAEYIAGRKYWKMTSGHIMGRDECLRQMSVLGVKVKVAFCLIDNPEEGESADCHSILEQLVYGSAIVSRFTWGAKNGDYATASLEFTGSGPYAALGENEITKSYNLVIGDCVGCTIVGDGGSRNYDFRIPDNGSYAMSIVSEFAGDYSYAIAGELANYCSIEGNILKVASTANNVSGQILVYNASGQKILTKSLYFFADGFHDIMIENQHGSFAITKVQDAYYRTYHYIPYFDGITLAYMVYESDYNAELVLGEVFSETQPFELKKELYLAVQTTRLSIADWRGRTFSAELVVTSRKNYADVTRCPITLTVE